VILAVGALEACGTPDQVVPVLERLSAREDADVRKAAAEALRRIRGGEAEK
jgi:HEAT repeat protein